MKSVRLRRAALLAVALGFAGSAAIAQPESDQQIRRYYIPEVEVPRHVKGMLPMRRDEFERLLERHSNAQPSPLARSEVPIRRADYFARFLRGQLIDGKAELATETWESGSPTLELGPMQLATSRFRWKAESTEWATTGLSSSGIQVLEVRPGASLQFSWSLAPLHRVSGIYQFHFVLPRASVGRLVIHLPDGWEPSVTSGIISRFDGDQRTDLPTSVLPSMAADEAGQLWLIELGGASTFDLEIQSAAARKEAAEVQQRLAYQVADSGLELSANLALDVSVATTSLELRVDPPLRIASARLGEQQLEVLELDESRVSIQFGAPLLPGSREVEITAFAPLTLGSEFSLPSLYVQNARWLHGAATLDVLESFELQRIQPVGYVETSVEPLPAPLVGESRSFQAYSEDARLRVLMTHRKGRLRLVTASSLRLTDSSITANQVSTVTCDAGEIYSLEFQSPSEWTVDSIQTTPPDVLDNVTTTGRESKVHHLRLRRPITSERPVEVAVRAHRRAPTGARQRLFARDFRPVEFLGGQDRTNVVSLLAEPPLQLQFFNDATLKRVLPADLAANVRDLIEWPPGSIVYEDQPQSTTFGVNLRAEGPNYQARTDVVATVSSGRIHHRYSIQCEPQSGPVSRLQVRLTGPADDAIRWSIDGGVGVTATRLTSSPLAEVWELALRSPRVEAFQLVGTSSGEFRPPAKLTLISLPKASAQTASLTIAAADGSSLAVVGDGVRSIPGTNGSPVMGSRGHFRYDPTANREVEIRRVEANGQPSVAWIWRCEVTSRFDQAGAGTHRAVLELENLGAARTVIRIPVIAEIVRATINDVPVSLAASSQQRNIVTVALPRGERQCVIQVEYTTDLRPLGMVSSVSAPLPLFDLPCLHRTWTVWLSPGYRPLLPQTERMRWDERLFGSTVLRQERAPFNFFALPHWRALVDRLTVDTAATRLADSVVQAVGRTSSQVHEVVTWGSVVRNYASNRQLSLAPLPPLVIDTRALSAAGVTTQSPVRWKFDSRGLADIAAWLEGDNLALIVHAERAVLTGIASLPAQRSELVPTRFRNVFVARDPRVVRGVELASTDQLVEPSRWLEHDGELEHQLSRLPAEVMAYGWTNQTIELLPGQPASLRVVRANVVTAVGWSVLLITAAAVLSAFRDRRRRLPYAVVVAAGMTLFVPAGFAAVPRGIFLGLLLAAAVLGFRRGIGGRLSPMWLKTTHILVQRAVGFVVVCCAADTLAQSDVADRPIGGEASVVIPVDDDLEVTGEVVYVPPPLYDLLNRPISPGATSAWLLETAHYEVALTGHREGVLRVGHVSALFQARVRHQKTRISFPFNQSNVRRIAATIDGHPVTSNWRDGQFEIEVAVPGDVRIGFEIEPIVESDADRYKISLSVPRIPTSVLSVVGPAADITVLGALGAVSHGTSDRMQTPSQVDLGPTNNFQLSWAAATKSNSELDVQRLLWLHVQPDSLMLDVVHRVAVMSGQTDEFRLVADPTLVLQEPDDSEPIATYSFEDGPQQTIILRLDRAYPAGSEFTLKTRFLIPDTSGIGRLDFPAIRVHGELSGELSVAPWLAISIPPSIAASASLDSGSRSIPPAEFSMLWPVEEPLPTLAYRLDSPEAAPLLDLEPRPSESVVDQETHVLAGMEFAELRYLADVETTGASVLQHQLEVPPGLEISSVTAPDGEYDRLLRWSRPSAGRVVLFYSEPADALVSIDLRALIRVPPAGSFNVPRIRLADGGVDKDLVHLHRQDDVDLQLDGVRLETRPEATDDKVGGRYIGSILNRDPNDPLIANVAVNQPTARATSVTQLEYDGENWVALIDVEVLVDGGVVDRIRLDVPGDWEEASLELTPNIEMRLDDVAGTMRKTLTVAPSEAISQSFKLLVRAQLTSPPDRSFEAPDVSVLDMASVERFLHLPKRIGSQLADWVVRGLESQPDEETVLVYRVAGPSMQASLSDVRRAAGQPQLHLADYRLSFNADGTCSGVAIFDLEPALQQYCMLRMPEGFQLIQATVGGVPAAHRAGGQGRPWALRLESEKLPQRIEVLFSGMLPAWSSPIGDRRLVAPTLVDLPAIQTLWTVEYSHGDRLRPLLQHTQVGPTKQLEIRLQTIRGLLEIADSDERARTAVAEYDAWRLPWLALERHTDRLLRMTDTEVGSSLSLASAMDAAAVAQPRGYALHWQMHADASTLIHSAVQGDSPEIIVEYERKMAVSSFAGLVVMGLGLVAVAIGGAAVRRTTLVREWITRWPHAVGVLTGIGLWLIATPSLAGWLFILLFVLSALRPSWRSAMVARSSP